MPIKAGAHVYRSTDSRRRVEIKTVTHSYQELLDAFHILSDNMIRLGIQSVALREAENVVLVTPEPGGHAALQKEIDTLVDSDVVKIEYPIAQNSVSDPEMKHVFTKDIDVKPGTEVTGGYSIGYAAGWDGKLGYTVPGHAVLVGGTVKYNGETLGTVRYRALGGPLDIAFVEKEDKNGFLGIGALKFKGSNVTPEGEFVGSMGRAVISGERVHFRGYRSQKQIGNIINASFSAVVDGIQMTDCAQANYVAIGGDSGGCVYYYDDYPYEPRQLSKVLGTQSFSLLQNGNWVDDSYSVFSKKSNQTQIEVLSW